MTFGCAPTTGVPALSTIADSYTHCINKHLNENGGVMQLPDALQYFKEYVPQAGSRSDTTQKLFFDVAKRGGVQTKSVTTTPKTSKMNASMKGYLSNLISKNTKLVVDQ